jgi:hypothetical protein
MIDEKVPVGRMRVKSPVGRNQIALSPHPDPLPKGEREIMKKGSF